MVPVSRIAGIAAPLPLPNVNTDDIYPGPSASPLLRKYPEQSGSRGSAGANAFAGWRYADDLSPREDFVLNRAPYGEARILLGGANFGCGSSRELAVWALQQLGIDCIVALGFADIFQDNCVKNGLLPARVSESDMARLLSAEARKPGAAFTVDLNDQTILLPDQTVCGFLIDRYPRQLMLAGHDEITAALAEGAATDRFGAAYLLRRPWLQPPAAAECAASADQQGPP